MRRMDMALVAGVFALGAFVAHEAVGMHGRPGTLSASEANGTIGADVSVDASSALPAPARDIRAIRRHIAERAGGTFIDEILGARDSSIARWYARPDKPIRVWVQDRSSLDGFDASLPLEVHRAFGDWGVAGVPLAFAFVKDSSRAEVTVSFVDRFEETMSGRTRWVRDPNWWIVGGDIQLSLHSGSGRLLTAQQVYAIALHEIGHLIGLDHASDTTAIMAPRVRTLSLTPIDVATMRLIYEVEPGSIKTR